MRPAPYIGVTGLTRRGQVDELLRYAPSGRLLMVGVLASRKSLSGLPVKWPGRYPTRSALGLIFMPHQRVLNLIHLHVEVDHRDELFKYMLDAQEIAGPYCHGFQLNVQWPDPCELERFKMNFPKKKLVLQVGRGMLDEVARDWEKLMTRLRPYQGLVDYVLCDPSGGKAQPLDPEDAVEFAAALEASMPDVGPVIAGGLSHANVRERILALQPRVGPFSIDAEGGLRSPTGDSLNLKDALTYILQADVAMTDAARAAA